MQTHTCLWRTMTVYPQHTLQPLGNNIFIQGGNTRNTRVHTDRQKHPHIPAIYRACESEVGGDSLALHSCASCWCASLMTNQLVQCSASCCSDPAKRNVLDLRTPQQSIAVTLCFDTTGCDSVPKTSADAALLYMPVYQYSQIIPESTMLQCN